MTAGGLGGGEHPGPPWGGPKAEGRYGGKVNTDVWGYPFEVDLRNLGESDEDVGHVGSQARDLTHVFGNGLLGK